MGPFIQYQVSPRKITRILIYNRIKFALLRFMQYNLLMHEIDWTKSNGQIAKDLDVSASTVSRMRKRLGLEPSTHAKNYRSDLHTYSSKTKPIRDLDYEFALYVRKDGRKKANKAFRKAALDYYGNACMACGYNKERISNHCLNHV